MARSLLEELPRIVAEGRTQAQRILEQLDGPNRIALQTREIVLPNRSSGGFDFGSDQAETPLDPSTMNRLIYGDNLLAMAALLAGDEQTPSLRGKVDLIYIDPPFDSKADYRTKLELPGGVVGQRPTLSEQFAYSDTWSNGTRSYLEMLTPRITLINELLSESGSLYLHVGIQASHYVKIICDEIFGRSNFNTEVIWSYGTPSGGRAAGNKIVKAHEYILSYAKNYGRHKYNKEFLPYSDKYVADRFTETDETGRVYRTRERAPGTFERQYLDESKGVPLSTVWTDVKQLYAAHYLRRKEEETGYATQKPQQLLRRIIEIASDPEDLVVDFFSGSGTTAAVAEILGRRWITSDLGKPAVMITRKRLVDANAKPFLYQAIGDYQVEQARSTLGRKFRVGDLARTVLGIYGALPLPEADNVSGQLGSLPDGKTLVMVDSPSRVTTRSTLDRARQYRDEKLGGFERVVVLGWNFPPGIGRDVEDLNDPKLEVRVIPANLLDELKKKGDKLDRSKVRFSTLQYLDAHLDSRVRLGEQTEFRIQLDNYVLLDASALPLDDADRDAVRELAEREPLALIEYWAVDPDYDGETFRSSWQDYRGNEENDHDPLRCVTLALVSAAERPGPRKIAIRAIDVFGFESEVVLDVDEAVE